MPTGWFYVDQGQQRGPVATEELAGWIQSFAETGMKAVVDVQSTRSGA